MVNTKRFYTYAYLREDRTPYYIGKGNGRRAYKKGKGEVYPPKDKSRIIFLKQNLTEEEAHKHEMYMIAVFGRKDLGTGILRNKTDGGEGVSGSIRNEKSRERIRKSKKGEKNYWYGKSHSDETKKKMRENKEVKSFSIISPTGEIIYSKNAKQFCRDNNLNNGHFSKVLNGKRQSHKGFRLYKGEDT